MILTIKTDSNTAELTLHEADKQVAEYQWEAGRQLAEQILEEIKKFCKQNGTSVQGLTGLVIFRGPGSFTGLRIGVTVANAMAYAQKIPIVGELDEDWKTDGLRRLAAGQNDTQVIPEYGSAPNITKPRK